MLTDFWDQCAPDAGLRPVSSLNELSTAEQDDDSAPPEIGDCIADPTVDLEAELSKKQLLALVRQFVAGLSPNLRCIVVRHYLLGHSQAKIAEDLGVTRSAVCHALRRVHKLGYRHFQPFMG